jgi:putative RecB family exonuclease
MTGSALDLPFPSSLSPSRASDFMACPLLFRFRSIDRLPEEPSPAAIRGTLVHRALEVLFDLPAPERTHAATVELVERAWHELVHEDPESARVLEASGGLGPEIGTLVEGYFALEDPRRLQPHARELGVSAQVAEGFEARGFIDRVDLAPDGAVRIVDYKTGRSPSPGFESKPMFQMRFYALVWWRMTGVVPRLLRLMYLGNREMLSYEPDQADLERTQAKVLALRDAIGTAADRGDFAATPSRLCDWCSHRALCPAWGGSPPPLPPRSEWMAGTGRPSVEQLGVVRDEPGG